MPPRRPGAVIAKSRVHAATRPCAPRERPRRDPHPVPRACHARVLRRPRAARDRGAADRRGRPRDLGEPRRRAPVRAVAQEARQAPARPGVRRQRLARRGDRQGEGGRRLLYRAGDRARGDGQAAAAPLVHGDAGRPRRRVGAGRVPPHRPAAQDRARGAPQRAAAGEPRADPQPRARDQEPARRHPRRGAAARARARRAAADRVHAGDHRRGRPAAVAGQPAAHAAPAAARSARSTCTRCWCA